MAARFVYLGLLAGCLLVTLPLELVLRVRVYARWRRLLLTVLPVAAVYLGWDAAAVAAGDWHYDHRQLIGVYLPGRLPIEELLFFLVIPTCAVLTLEAVRRARGWPVGDER
jgi:lycopene cyclase domain-containing protein